MLLFQFGLVSVNPIQWQIRYIGLPVPSLILIPQWPKLCIGYSAEMSLAMYTCIVCFHRVESLFLRLWLFFKKIPNNASPWKLGMSLLKMNCLKSGGHMASLGLVRASLIVMCCLPRLHPNMSLPRAEVRVPSCTPCLENHMRSTTVSMRMALQYKVRRTVSIPAWC